MVTTTTSLLHDIEEYFADTVAWRENFPRLHPSALLKRAYEQIVDLEDKVYTLERRPRRVEDFSDDNDDS
jgi:ubiquinone biosynthesis protein UbiJ